MQENQAWNIHAVIDSKLSKRLISLQMSTSWKRLHLY